jgi:oligoendopeptidase F
MANWKTLNLEEEYYQELEKFIQTRPEYNSVKEIVKDSVNRRREQLQNQEQKQIIQLLETLLQQTDITKEEVVQTIREKN